MNFSRTGRWVDITVLNKKFLSADDIARPRRKVVDDDQQIAYTGGGLGNAELRCGRSALRLCAVPSPQTIVFRRVSARLARYG